MRDLVAWYIVELRRRLTSVDPQSRVEDFLLETRTHIDESVDEMTSRGIAEDDATKAAITDFGHPSLVAAAFRGRRHMSARTYWVLMVIAFLTAVPALVQVVSSSTDNAMGYMHMTTFDFGMASVCVFGMIALTGFLSRRWCAIPLTLGALVLTVAVGGWFMNRTSAYAMEDGSDKFVLLSGVAAKDQVKVREAWLEQYDQAVPKLKAALVAPTDRLLLDIVSQEYGGYSMPATIRRTSYPTFMPYPKVIPGTDGSIQFYPVRWISIEESPSPLIYISQVGDQKTAVDAWRKDGAAYLTELAAHRSRVLREIDRFKAPASVARGEVMSRLIWFPLTIVSVFSLLGLALNGVAIMMSDVAVSVRRLRWKRRFV
jgi:hypothetical protein